MVRLTRASAILFTVAAAVAVSCTFNPHDPSLVAEDAAPPMPDGFAGVDHGSGMRDAGSADVGPCTPIGCNPAGGQYCGQIGDGCGGNQNCGDCPTGQICGAFMSNVCGDPGCTATVLTCSPTGG